MGSGLLFVKRCVLPPLGPLRSFLKSKVWVSDLPGSRGPWKCLGLR